MSDEPNMRTQAVRERVLQLAIQHRAESDTDFKQLLADELIASGRDCSSRFEGHFDEPQLAQIISQTDACLTEGNWEGLSTLMRDPLGFSALQNAAVAWAFAVGTYVGLERQPKEAPMYQAMNEAAGVTTLLLVSNVLAELERTEVLTKDQSVELVDRTLLTVEHHFHEILEAEELMDACRQMLERLLSDMRK